MDAMTWGQGVLDKKAGADPFLESAPVESVAATYSALGS
jgi:hypothetical protein